jgi:hypothetical protein
MGLEKCRVPVIGSFKLSFSRPQSRTSASRYCSDYLYHFCDHILTEITKKEDTAREKLKAEWHFTTPGLWDVPTSNDFRMLASEVVHKLLPKCTVVVELTEALTSHLFLKKRFQLNTAGLVVTCDIGGATIDTAVSVSSHMVFPISAKHTPLLSGVNQIDTDMIVLLRQSRPKREGLLGQEILTSWGWKKARHSASGDDITVRLDSDLGKHQSDEYTIDGEMMKISWFVIILH